MFPYKKETKTRRFNTFNFNITSRLLKILPWLGVFLFLGIFFFIPLFRILELGLNPSSLDNIGFSSLGRTFSILIFTFYQALLSTFVTLLLGLPSAYLFAQYRFHCKLLLRILVAIPFMLPTVVVAAGFSALLGPRGWINIAMMDLFGFEKPPIHFVGTLAAILLAHVFYNTTIVIRLVANALSHLDSRQEHAARVLGADSRRVFWHVTLPLLYPSILAASLLVFLFDFTSFGVILLLGGPRFSTLEVEIYLQAMQFLNLPLASLLSLIQLCFILVFSFLYSKVIARAIVTSTPRASDTNLRRAKNWREKIFIAGMILFLLAFFVLPLVSLPVRSVTRLEAARGERGDVQYGITADYYQELFINRRESLFYVPPFKAVINSLGYAVITIVLSLLIGFPVASALARPGRFERLLDPFIMLPIGASAVTLGLGFIVSFNRPPFALITSPLLVPIVHTLIALPFVIRSLQPALASIPHRLRQAASSLGASPFRAWFTVDWPIVSKATLSAVVFAFTVSLGEFGASSLVVRPEYPTLPIAVARFLSQPGGLNYGQAMAMATILMLICSSGIFFIEKLRLPGTLGF